MKTDLQIAADVASLKADLAKLDALTAQVQSEFDDPELTIVDVVGIEKIAHSFGVLRRHAYFRARELGLLSYQQRAATHPDREGKGGERP